MLDIVAMIFQIIKNNMPADLVWSPMAHIFHATCYFLLFALVFYCLIFNFL